MVAEGAEWGSKVSNWMVVVADLPDFRAILSPLIPDLAVLLRGILCSSVSCFEIRGIGYSAYGLELDG